MSIPPKVIEFLIFMFVCFWWYQLVWYFAFRHLINKCLQKHVEGENTKVSFDQAENSLYIRDEYGNAILVTERADQKTYSLSLEAFSRDPRLRNHGVMAIINTKEIWLVKLLLLFDYVPKFFYKLGLAHMKSQKDKQAVKETGSDDKEPLPVVVKSPVVTRIL